MSADDKRPRGTGVSPCRDDDGNLHAFYRDEALAAGWTPPTSADDTETQRVERLSDDALDGLLKVQEDLRASMRTDLNGHDFKDGEIEALIVLAASVTHLVHDLRAARAAGDDLAVEREKLAVVFEAQAQKCRAVTPNDYTEGSHDAYLNAARIARTNPGEGGAE